MRSEQAKLIRIAAAVVIVVAVAVLGIGHVVIHTVPAWTYVNLGILQLPEGETTFRVLESNNWYYRDRGVHLFLGAPPDAPPIVANVEVLDTDGNLIFQGRTRGEVDAVAWLDSKDLRAYVVSKWIKLTPNRDYRLSIRNDGTERQVSAWLLQTVRVDWF